MERAGTIHAVIPARGTAPYLENFLMPNVTPPAGPAYRRGITLRPAKRDAGQRTAWIRS